MSQKLLYTYLDEVVNLPDVDLLYRTNGYEGISFGITSVTFEQNHYINFFEKEWSHLRTRYGIDEHECLHFTEYKKLLVPSRRSRSQAFKYFSNTDGTFNKTKYIYFLKDIKNLIERSNFFIVFTDVFRLKKGYINHKRDELTSDVNYGKKVLKKLPEITMSKHLNSLLKCLILNDSLILDETRIRKVTTKIRIDSDGKDFAYKNPFKIAYNSVISHGSESFYSTACYEMLDELRFIRKEEVSNLCSPSHCGLELVDFLCSNIARYHRIEYLNSKVSIPIDNNAFLFNVNGEIIDFQSAIEKKYRYVNTYENDFS